MYSFLHVHINYSLNCLTIHLLGDENEKCYIHHIVSSTLQLSDTYEDMCRLPHLVNVGECLWQTRAQAMSQEVNFSLHYTKPPELVHTFDVDSCTVCIGTLHGEIMHAQNLS